nr:hypothetical protein [Rhizobium lusitanum]
MAAYVEWFNRSAPNGESPLSALTRAGIGHLYFESIHSRTGTAGYALGLPLM